MPDQREKPISNDTNEGFHNFLIVMAFVFSIILVFAIAVHQERRYLPKPECWLGMEIGSQAGCYR